jgi:hypothetical protein
MRKLLAVSLVLNVAMVVGFYVREMAANAEGGRGGGGTPVGNGDVNADGVVDLSDAVYTLLWLFGDGNAPVPYDNPALVEQISRLEAELESCRANSSFKGLPATGQTKCHDTVGGEIGCGSVDYPGQDGSYQAGCPTAGRFTDNGDGTVTDTCTDLMWQNDTADVNGSGSIEIEFPGDRLDWQNALKYCDDLGFAGHDDWRLPNVRELQSIVDYGRFSPSIDPVFGAVSDWYWSSSSIAYSPDVAWSVLFDSGFIYGGDAMGDRYFVRAVRGRP